ncbi:MAG: M48 family metalloprotease [Phaeodactylibacter sp.]|nr:M48 family metalloprotease [Phaeodactylibacter sp.]MCB9048643.1 M48 family metalloprotease [Lewinellaceae bacterium]
MSTITHWIDTNLAETLGWVLLHSLWQGAAIALLLAFALILARRLSSNVRYWIALSALLSLLLACIGTFAWIYEPGPEPTFTEDVTLLFFATQEALPSGATAAAKEASTDHPAVYIQYFKQHMPLLVTGWLLGVLLLSLRMLGEIAYIQHLRHYRCRQPERIWLEKLAKIKEKMGILREVELRETYRIHGPMVVGVLKQVILLPAGLLSGLPPEQVEAVLAHELAHVRRNDYLINLFVSLVEILLFFNPMMWWISKKIRAEREHACDDLAVEMTGDTLSLVRSLALMEEWRLHGPSPAMAFMGKDGSVLSRIQRLLQRDDKRQVAAKAFWSLSIICVCLALLAFQSKPRETTPAPASLPEAISPETMAEPASEDLTEASSATTIATETKQPPIAWAEPAMHPTDTIPPEAQQLEKEARKLEEKMQASELELRKKEQAIQRREIQLRKETQEAMQAQRKALLQLEIQMRTKEHEREMQESEFELAQHELEAASLELEEQRQALEMQQEELEDAEGEELAKKLKFVQQSQREILEKERALQLRMFEAQKNQRQAVFEKEKSIQELEHQRFQLEQQIEMKEQEMAFQMMSLQHEMQQIEADQRMMEQEMQAKYRELEAKMMELADKEEE